MIGTKTIENGIIKYGGDSAGQGFFFKDSEAFEKRRDDICYISEAGFGAKDWLSEDEAKAEIEKGGAITHNSLFNEVKEEFCSIFGENNVTDEFVENVCEYIFNEVDWQCASTLFNEIDWDEEYRCYWNEHGKHLKTKNEYLEEIIDIAQTGDTIKFLEDGIALTNVCGSPLSKWIEKTKEVIYF